jgi:hypothetical protein
MLRGAAFLLVALAAQSCGPDTDPPADAGPPDASHPGCTLEFLGDPSKEPELEITALGAQAPSVIVHEGDTVPLIFPPQGGRVIFAGARATNLDPCGVKLAGGLRDPATKQLRVDIRTVNLKPGDDGWGASDDTDFSTFSNVPICPNNWASTSAYDATFELTITVTDRAMRTISKTLNVVPTCAEPDKLKDCLCICKQGYVLGESCDGDGGVGDGGS